MFFTKKNALCPFCKFRDFVNYIIDTPGDDRVWHQFRGVMRFCACVNDQRACTAPVLELRSGPNSIYVMGGVGSRETDPEEVFPVGCDKIRAITKHYQGYGRPVPVLDLLAEVLDEIRCGVIGSERVSLEAQDSVVQKMRVFESRRPLVLVVELCAELSENGAPACDDYF